MSISKGADKQPAQETLYKDRHFKKVFEAAKEIISNTPITGIFYFIVVITGIACLFGRPMGFAWYLFLFLFFTLFAFQEFFRLTSDIKPEIIIEKPTETYPEEI